MLKTIGSATTHQEIEQLENQACEEIEKLTAQPKLFLGPGDTAINQAFAILNYANIRTLLASGSFILFALRTCIVLYTTSSIKFSTVAASIISWNFLSSSGVIPGNPRSSILLIMEM